MLLGIDTSGTLFVYHDVVSPDESDWVELSSDNWLSVAIRQKGPQAVRLMTGQLAQKKTALRSSAAGSGDSETHSSSDEYMWKTPFRNPSPSAVVSSLQL